mmetsp:Transcript_24370/g.24640  ORF Transcript_24370/g.24640 Transcript_24370/m.24640 type:complete len:260 (-) Transcript_24370:142-921(-)
MMSTTTMTMTMMINIRCIILSITLSISVTSAFSSVSSSRIIALRPSRFELSSTQQFDSEDDDFSIHPHRVLLDHTTSDVISKTTSSTAAITVVNSPSITVVNSPYIDAIQVQHQQHILHVDNNNALVDMESIPAPNTNALPCENIKKIAWTRDNSLKKRYVNKIKMILKTDEKLKKRYAIVLGRLFILCISFLPLVSRHEMMHKEEYLIQLFLLGISMQPFEKSVTLAKCITNSETGVEECQLEFEDLEDTFDIEKPRP